MEITKEYASKGVAGAGLGTGIAGLSLGVLNSLGGLAGLAGAVAPRSTVASSAGNDALTAVLAASLMRGGCGCGCGDGAPVTQRELSLTQQLAEKDMQIALRDADAYTDSKNLEMYKYIDGQIRDISATLGAQAVQNQANKDSLLMLQQQMAADKAELKGDICRERDERKCSDNAIVNYVNATFYPKMVADVTTGTTTTAQSTYNPLPACTCGCNC